MTHPGMQTKLTNWSKSALSPCFVYHAGDVAGINRGLALARQHGLSAIAHGAGHSYTDAALNTAGIVIDVTSMRRILSWDSEQGIIRVEPGVTLRDIVQRVFRDGWWPVVSPSTPDVTIGGCTAMNVNGKNAWKCGPFGEYVRAIEVLLATGEIRTLLPDRDSELFHAMVGGTGLLGILTAITMQLQRLVSSRVNIERRCTTSLAEIFSVFAEAKPKSDFLEAWLDGAAEGQHLGRGLVTSAALETTADETPIRFPTAGSMDKVPLPVARWAGSIGRPVFVQCVPLANRARYWWGARGSQPKVWQQALLPYTYYPRAAFAGYHTALPEGIETFQAFVPGQQHAQEIFAEVVRYSQQQGCIPIWCIIKEHRQDLFLLSYQVDGFSLELNYPRTRRNASTLERVLRQMLDIVIEAGGRFYLAKDHFLSAAQYRRSVGDGVVDTFLRLKQQYDPDMLLQSDQFRRLFQPLALE